jgi:hypothetical protein
MSEVSHLAISIAVPNGELAVQCLQLRKDIGDILAPSGMACTGFEDGPSRVGSEMSHLMGAVACPS